MPRKNSGMKRAIPRHRVQCRDAASRQERSYEKAERQAGKHIVEVDFDEATYVGDEDDGVYYQVGEKDRKFYVSTSVDCNSAHFTDSLITDEGPFDTEAQARSRGRAIAEGWCNDNQVDFEPANNHTAQIMQKFMKRPDPKP